MLHLRLMTFHKIQIYISFFFFLSRTFGLRMMTLSEGKEIEYMSAPERHDDDG